MLDYHTKGCDRFGASMGRKSDLPSDFEGKVLVREVPIDDGGYDPGGAYWGTGQRLYFVQAETGECAYSRARDRLQLLRAYPKAMLQEQEEITEQDLAEAWSGYITAAFLTTSEPEESGIPGLTLDERFTTDSLEPEVEKKLKMNLALWVQDHAELVLRAINETGNGWHTLGQDLWYSSNHIGDGFQDGEWDFHVRPEGVCFWACFLPEDLDAAAGDLAPVDLVVTSDGKIAV